MVDWLIMANRKDYGIPIIIAIVGIIPALFPLQSIYNQTFGKPHVNIQVMPSSNKALIELTNGGYSPATNLSLFVETPKNITAVYKHFSTANITLLKYIHNLLEMHVQKFVQGDGSKIILETIIDRGTLQPNEYYDNYTARASYDQGSDLGFVGKPTWEQLFDRTFRGTVQNNPILFTILLYIYFLIVFPIAIAFSKKYLEKRKYNKLRIKYNSIIMNEMITIRNILKNNSKYEQIISSDTWYKLNSRKDRLMLILFDIDDVPYNE